jgi:hypothetical protein
MSSQQKTSKPDAGIPDKSSESKRDIFAKGKDFLDMYNKVVEFTRELINQNEMLKKRVEDMKDEQKRLQSLNQTPNDVGLQKKIQKLRDEKHFLLEQYRQKEEETKNFLDRYYEIELENNNLANLYVASYQLHSTLDIREVLDIITEIIINLIGAQTFGILLYNEKKSMFYPAKVEGMSQDSISPVTMGEGIIGSVAESGETYYREQDSLTEEIDVSHPMVCVPMKVENRTIGVIVVYRLLSQKEKLTKVDYELFTLLAAHAATAIFSARLYTDSIRKRKTIKGFLDLVTS